MKLSEALMLSTHFALEPKSWTCEGGGCLLHNAGLAVGKEINHTYDAVETWPWLMVKQDIPEQLTKFIPEIMEHYSCYLSPRGVAPAFLIQWLAYGVKAGRITIEQVADWVRSIEPEEENDEGAGGSEGDRVVSAWIRSIEPEEAHDEGAGSTEGDRVVPAREKVRTEALAGSER